VTASKETDWQVASQDNAMAKSFDGAGENRAGKAFRQDPASSAGGGNSVCHPDRNRRCSGQAHAYAGGGANA